MRAPEYLIDFQAHDGADVITLRVSTCGYVTRPADTPANTVYVGCVADPGTFEASFFGAGQTMGDAETGYGEIVLVNVNGRLDAWLTYAFDGRPFTIRRIASKRVAFSTAEIVMTGTVQSIDSSNAKAEIRMRVYDRRLALEVPLQVNRYAGTTLSGGATAEGTADLKDQLKPLVFGRVFNVPCKPVNPFDLIYQVSDSAVASIVAYDGGAPLTATSDYADVATLRAATIVPGGYATCLALGLIRLGWSPIKEVTADVVEGATLAARYPAAITRRLLARRGFDADDIDLASFTALDAAAPMECGIFVDGDETVLSVATKILNSVGGTILPDALGIFVVGRISAPSVPVSTITANNVVPDGQEASVTLVANPDTDGGVPVWRVIIRYRKVWQTMDTGQTSDCVDDDTRAFLAVEYRESKAEDAAVKVRSLLAGEMTIDTCLAQLADATAEAARRLALYGVERFVIVAPTMARNVDTDKPLGSSVSLDLPIGPFDGGRPMVVIGRGDIRASERVNLTLWG